jgi:hypothetical protein
MKTQSRHLAGSTVALIFVALLVGCSGEGVQAFADLVPLQRQLAAEYGASSITFDVPIQDSDTLGITFVNSSFNRLTGAQQAELAREIASFVCENYGSMGKVDTVSIAFESDQDGFLAVASGSVSFAFEKSELACGGR